MTDYEPTFSDIQRILKSNDDVLRTDDELKNDFPNGTKDFQICYRRGAANIKEILAPSKISLQDTINENNDQRLGSYPCGKECVYCQVLRKTEGDRFRSTKTGYTYKVRQRIDCESQNVIYLVTCGKGDCHNFQGIGQSKAIKERFSNYRNHHNTKYNSCGVTEHFLQPGHDFNRDFQFKPIVTLTNTRGLTEVKLKQRREDFELYWQDSMFTIEPHGMNKRSEAEKTRKRQLRQHRQARNQGNSD